MSRIKLVSGAAIGGGSLAFRPPGLIGSFDASTAIFEPVDLTLTDATIGGNKFDAAEVTWTATHSDAVTTQSGRLWYAGDRDGSTGNDWKITFTPTKVGVWTVTTPAGATSLNGASFSVNCTAAASAYGFVTNSGDKWAIQRGDGTTDVLAYQLAMGSTRWGDYDASFISTWISTYITGSHRFGGAHIHSIGGRWQNIDSVSSNEGTTMSIIANGENPDNRTYDKIVAFAEALRAEGAVLHIWQWGDNSRDQTPDRYTNGENGAEHQRMMRHLMARLAPYPNIVFGYGFDNTEWSSPTEVETARTYCLARTSYPKILGVRSPDPQTTTAITAIDGTNWHDNMDYAGWEILKNTLTLSTQDNINRTVLGEYASKPHLSEDRCRATSTPDASRQFDADEIPLIMWINAISGGIGEIVGFLTSISDPYDGTGAFPAQQQTEVQTWATFWKTNGWFVPDLASQNARVGAGIAARSASGAFIVCLVENASSLGINLAAISGDAEWTGKNAKLTAIDIRAAYFEVDEGTVSLTDQTVTFTGTSDWALLIEAVDP